MIITEAWYSIFTNPAYIIQTGIYKEVIQFSMQAKGPLLDFGCGVKPYRKLFKTVDSYIGIDYPSDRFNGHKALSDLDYNGVSIQLANNSIETILCTEVFEHVFNIDLVLTEMHRVLNQNGQLFITCPFALGEHEQPYDFARYTSFGLKHILEKNNFEIISYKKRGNTLSTILQLTIILLNNFISKLGLLKYVLLAPILLLLNSIALISETSLLRKIFKTNLYLSNIVICKKKST